MHGVRLPVDQFHFKVVGWGQSQAKGVQWLTWAGKHLRNEAQTHPIDTMLILWGKHDPMRGETDPAGENMILMHHKCCSGQFHTRK